MLNVELESQISFLKNNYLKVTSKNDMTILDLCCGTGRHVKKLNDEDYMVDGVDINPEAVNTAQKSIINNK